ncbi:MAG: pilin, partial [Candidatus Magasanikbacteria bacterium]|nr:pilin [Candidatus Magasanikbacteria bacterium]
VKIVFMKSVEKVLPLQIIFFLAISFFIGNQAKADEFKWELCQDKYDKSWSCVNSGYVAGSSLICGDPIYNTESDCNVDKNKKTPPAPKPPANPTPSPNSAGDYMCNCSDTCNNFSAPSIEDALAQCKDKNGAQCNLSNGTCPSSNSKNDAAPVPLNKGDEVRCVCETPGGKSDCIYDLQPKVWTQEIPNDCAAKSDKTHLNCQIEEGNCEAYQNSTKIKLDSLKVEAKQKLNPVGFGTGTSGFLKLVGTFIAFLMFPIGGFAMLMYIYAGYMWMTGSPDNITKAKSILTWTTLGIVAALSSYLLVQFVFSNLFS